MKNLYTRTLLPLIAIASLSMAPTAMAQEAWPNKPIRLVVPYPAGGSSDNIGRFVAQGLERALGQAVVVENKGGAGGTIGAELVSRAAGDGYTFLVAPTAVFAITAHLRKVPYDPFNDFIPIAKLTGSYSIATARKDAPFNTMQELVAAAKKAPGKYTYGSAGSATATHLAGEMVSHKAGIKLLHVPYKGSAAALADLLGGQIDMIFDPVSLTQVKAGNVKAIGVMSKSRHPELPDVATVQEQGLDLDTRSWFAIFAPKGTPKAIVDRVAAEAEKMLKSDDTRAELLKVSQYPDYVGPAAFAAQVKKDSAFFKDLITSANIRVE